jgi:hypothetical protein
MNIALLLKWIWKLYQGAEGLWVDILKAKYLGDRDVFAHETPWKGSQFWSALQKVKWYFKLGARHHVQNGNQTYFWLDWWLGNTPLRDRYPQLFDCCAFPFIMVRAARQGQGWGILFRRPLGVAETIEWENLTRELDGVVISDSQDGITWNLEQSGVFSTRSMYLRLSQGAEVSHFDDVWRTKVPPRVRIFLWQLIRGRLPCSEQVAKRMGPSNGTCAWCGEVEDCDHIFFKCAIARFMWAGVRELLTCLWNPAGPGISLPSLKG